LKGLFNIIDNAQNIFAIDFWAANAIAIHQTQAHAIKADMSYHKFQSTVSIQTIHINTHKILPSIGKTCLERSSQFFLLVIHLKIALITEFDKNNKAIINETLKALLKKSFNSIGICMNFIHR
jgi:hypothetical protein